MRDFVELSNNELKETNGGVWGLIIAGISCYIGFCGFCYKMGEAQGKNDRGTGRHR